MQLKSLKKPNLSIRLKRNKKHYFSKNCPSTEKRANMKNKLNKNIHKAFKNMKTFPV